MPDRIKKRSKPADNFDLYDTVPANYEELLASHDRLLKALEAIMVSVSDFKWCTPAPDVFRQARDAIQLTRKVRTG